MKADALRAVHRSRTGPDRNGPAWTEDRKWRPKQTEDRTEVLSVSDRTGLGKTEAGPDRTDFGPKAM